MTGVVLAVWCSVGLVVLALVLSVVDEFKLPPSNVRRTGVALAMIAGFAALWLLVTPITPEPNLRCEAPVLVLAEFATPPVMQPAACSTPMRINALAGLLAAALSPVLVFATRSYAS
jgi:hypothetical protein